MALGYSNLLIGGQGDGAALTNTTTATSILPGSARYTLLPNTIDFIGKKFRLTAMGRISTLATSPGTLTFSFRLGPTANIAAATSPAFALNVNAKTNVIWWLDWTFTARTLGSGTGATLMHGGMWTSEAVIGSPLPSAGGAGSLMIPASAPAVGTGFDSSVANVADLFAQWSVANAANSIQLHDYALESLN
jgi:hypothetical protein